MKAPDLDPWPLTIATYNIHGAQGTDGCFAPERIARVLRETRAEVIALQEVPLGGGRSPDVLEYLKSETGYRYAAAATLMEPEGLFGLVAHIGAHAP